ncbi:MAG: hypothetical protein ACR2HG_11675 [Pyrinomonadaceae bacterium]
MTRNFCGADLFTPAAKSNITKGKIRRSRRLAPFIFPIFSPDFRRSGIAFLKVFLLVFISLHLADAQEKQIILAPPPLKILSKAEKSQLKAETDVKRRTKLSLDLMDARLLKAEELNKQEKYKEMFDELGGFNALMDNTIKFLDGNDTNRGKVLDNFKRVELSLRRDITRLELIRRDLPIKYEFYVRQLVKYVREARTEAIEPMFGNTVLPDQKPR